MRKEHLICDHCGDAVSALFRVAVSSDDVSSRVVIASRDINNKPTTDTACLPKGRGSVLLREVCAGCLQTQPPIVHVVEFGHGS